MTVGCPWRATTAARLVDSLKATIAETMENIRIDCAIAITDLVTEIRDGGSATRRSLETQAMAIRAAFGNVVGNGNGNQD